MIDSYPLTPEQWDELHDRWPDGARLSAAFAIARDVAACADLLAGRPVDPARLDQDELANARERRLVQLVAPADLLEGAA